MTTVTIGGRTADTYPGVLDTVISQQNPTSTSGSGTSTQIANAVVGQAKKSLFRFTGLSNIVGPVVVSSVTMSFFRVNTTTSPNRNIVCKKLLRAATEAGASWNNYAAATPWQTAGAAGALDVDSTVIATGVIPFGNNQRFTVTGAGLTALVQDVINGVVSNPWLLLEVEDPATFTGGDYDIGATDRPTESQRPYMEVVYTTSITPTVSTTDVTVNNLSGNAVVTITLSSDALVGGVSGTVNTADITAIAGVDYTAQTGVAFNIPEGSASGTITIPILP